MRKLVMAALFALPMFGATAMAQDTLAGQGDAGRQASRHPA